jgi:hypothetical protein
VTGATWEIRSGTDLCNTGGTLVASGSTAAPIVTPTGRSGFGFTEFQVKGTGLNVFLPVLPAGQFYWLNVTPVGDGTGRSLITTTSGANCAGTPCGNDGMSFFNPGACGNPDDFSMGVNATVAGTPTPTPRPSPSPSPSPSGRLWYNDDYDGVSGLANEQDTFLGSLQFASVYDNFNVTGEGWNVTEVFSDNLENTNVTGANWEIRSGTTLLHTGGTLIATNFTATPIVTLIYCGASYTTYTHTYTFAFGYSYGHHLI